jgi:DNA-directed RNA polymerase subunit beta
MKFNAKMGRTESTGPMVLTNEDILAVVKILVDLRNGRVVDVIRDFFW